MQNPMYKSMVGKKKYSKIIPMYSPQMDKVLNTSKKEVKNGGTCSQPNSKKINPKNTQPKPVVKIDFGNKNFDKKNLVNQFQYGKLGFGNIFVQLWFR